MFPELFRIPYVNYPVHSYGLMLVIGLLSAIELAKFLARRSGMNPESFSNAAILALISGLIGARIAYVIQFHDEFSGGTFSENAWNAINLTSGGLTYYGGFLLAFPTLVAYAIWQKIPLLRGMDVIAPCLMIGLGFGRVGCFLNGCCYGQHADLPAPLAIHFPYYSPAYLDDFDHKAVNPPEELFRRDLVSNKERLMTPDQIKAQRDLVTTADAERSLPVINTQLISTVTALLIATITTFYFTLGGIAGRGFGLMMMLEGITRFLIEGLRTEPVEMHIGHLGLTLSQIIGIGVALGGVTLWIAAGLRKQADEQTLNLMATPAAG